MGTLGWDLFRCVFYRNKLSVGASLKKYVVCFFLLWRFSVYLSLERKSDTEMAELDSFQLVLSLRVTAMVFFWCIGNRILMLCFMPKMKDKLIFSTPETTRMIFFDYLYLFNGPCDNWALFYLKSLFWRWGVGKRSVWIFFWNQWMRFLQFDECWVFVVWLKKIIIEQRSEFLLEIDSSRRKYLVSSSKTRFHSNRLHLNYKPFGTGTFDSKFTRLFTTIDIVRGNTRSTTLTSVRVYLLLGSQSS